MSGLALHPNAAAVDADDLFHDVQSESQPLAAVVGGVRVLVQALEDQGLRFRADTAPGVAHRDVNEIMVRFQQTGFHHDRAFGRGELNGVVNEIDKRLQDPGRIGKDQRNSAVHRHFQADLFFLRGGPQHGDRLTDDIGDSDTAGFHPELAGFRARGFQQIADHVAELVYAAQHGFQVFPLLGQHFTRQSIQQNGYKMVDTSKRSAQFVGHMGQELIFELQLLLAAHIKRGKQCLTLDRVTHGARQLFAVKVSFDQIILHALVNGFGG